MRINRRRTIPLALLAALALTQGMAGTASATDYPNDYYIVFSDLTPVTVEYGEYWSFPLDCEGSTFYYGAYQPGLAVTTANGTPYAAQLNLYTQFGPTYPCSGTVSTGYEVRPLKAGSYDIKVGGTYDDGTDTHSGETPDPAHLVITKAALGIEARVTADPNNGSGAIVSARFTGRFVDEYQSSFFPGAALSPAGEWHITLKDEDGKVAVGHDIERSAGDDVLATSFYWNGAKPNAQYSATAEFVPAGASGANFQVSPATAFSYTAPAAQRPVPTSTATAKPTADLPDASGFGLPLWALILSVILILGLGVLVTILSVRLNRRPTAPAIGAVAA